jgi:signal transduction histidine kinase
MTSEETHEPQREAPRVLLLAVRPEEREALARPLSAGGPQVRLAVVNQAQEVADLVAAGEVGALICDLAAFTSLQEAFPAVLGGEHPLAVLVLASPGSEEQAAALVKREETDVLLRQGNYLPLLTAWLARALKRHLISWEEIGRIIRHEINNPLTGVLGNAELILTDPTPLSPQVRKRLSTIINLAVRMRDVVRTLEERSHEDNNHREGFSRRGGVEESPLAREAAR